MRPKPHLFFTSKEHEKLLQYLPREIPPGGFAKNTHAKISDGLLMLIKAVVTQKYQHLKLPFALSFHHDLLDLWLGRSPEAKVVFNRYFRTIDRGNNLKRATNAYTYTPELKKAARLFTCWYLLQGLGNINRPQEPSSLSTSVDYLMASTCSIPNVRELFHELVEEEEFDAAYIMLACQEIVFGEHPISYFEKHSRLYCKLQGLSKKAKAKLFKGWHNYDIECSAPTILKQLAGFPTPTIDAYIKDKHTYRATLAQELNIDVGDAKAIINSMFFGSISSPSQLAWDQWVHDEADLMFGITRILAKYDNLWARVDACKLSPAFTELRAEIRQVYQTIATVAKETARKTETGWVVFNCLNKKLILDGRWNARKVVSHLYFGVERQLLNVAIEELDQLGSYLLMHDGFISQLPVDTHALAQEIKLLTSFDVTYSHEVL